MADTPPPAPPAECEARVGYDRDRVMSGYILPTAAGPRTCIPFSTVAAYPPPGYKGDFYVDEFSDARMREQWAACKQEKACYERVSKAIKARQPPNREFETRNARHIYLIGKITEGPRSTSVHSAAGLLRRGSLEGVDCRGRSADLDRGIHRAARAL
jgi:hypothetical protein